MVTLCNSIVKTNIYIANHSGDEDKLSSKKRNRRLYRRNVENMKVLIVLYIFLEKEIYKTFMVYGGITNHHLEI